MAYNFPNTSFNSVRARDTSFYTVNLQPVLGNHGWQALLPLCSNIHGFTLLHGKLWEIRDLFN